MDFVSTGKASQPASLKEAVFRGLAPDGGLYMPRSIPKLPPELLSSFAGMRWPEAAGALAEALLPDTLEEGVLGTLAESALDFSVPLKRLTDGIFVLELFHGPTLAFKDVGARFMAALMAHFRGRNQEPLTILTATSGDTGGAVAQAFLGLPGIRVVILFPDGKVTPRQERQFSTLGANVQAVAVQGDFDDCQRLARAAFADGALRKELNLTSANSINVGRLMPQMFYYFHAWAELLRLEGGSAASRVLFSVPSGNFGNLAAGLMAKSAGLNGARFLASTNVNDGVPRYLQSGRFVPTPSVPTLSSAMDVGNPSNLARILYLYEGNIHRLREDLSGRSISDRETRESIRRTHDQTGYLLDPHSAVGLTALEMERKERPDLIGVLLATAHPSKFAETVESVLGHPIPVPSRLARCLEGERTVIPMAPEPGALRELLLEK
jgi:threonine synthase